MKRNHVQDFPPGTKVYLVGCSNFLRNVVIEHVTDSCTYVSGHRHDPDTDIWHKFTGETISNGTEASFREEEEQVRTNEKVPLIYPEGEFTMKELMALNEMSYNVARARLIEEGKCKEVGERKARGIPAKVYAYVA